jgi:WD40 repeat protein
LGIIYDRNRDGQTFYCGHRFEIGCIAMNHQKDIAASGDRSRYPETEYAEVHVWDALIGKKIIHFATYHKYGVQAVSFSTSGHYLVSIAEDTWNSLVIFYSPSGQWYDGFYLSSTSVSRSRMGWCAYADHMEYPILCGGDDGCLYKFKYINGSLVKVCHDLHKNREKHSVLCGLELEIEAPNTKQTLHTVLCGTTDGYLIQLHPDGSIASRISAHTTALYAMMPLHHLGNASSSNSSARAALHFGVLVTIGQDYSLRFWSKQLKLLTSINLMRSLLTIYEKVAPVSVMFSPERQSVAIQTDQNEILEYSIGNKSYWMASEGHCAGELHGLCVSPSILSEEFATFGDDGIVRVWNRRLQSCVRKRRLNYGGRAMAWSNDGKFLVLGIGIPGTDTSKDGKHTKYPFFNILMTCF